MSYFPRRSVETVRYMEGPAPGPAGCVLGPGGGCAEMNGRCDVGEKARQR